MTSQSPYRLNPDTPAQLQVGDVVSIAYRPSGLTLSRRRKPTMFAELTVISVDGDNVVASGKGVGAARFRWAPDPRPEVVDLGHHGYDATGKYSFWFKSRPIDNAENP